MYYSRMVVCCSSTARVFEKLSRAVRKALFHYHFSKLDSSEKNSCTNVELNVIGETRSGKVGLVSSISEITLGGTLIHSQSQKIDQMRIC